MTPGGSRSYRYYRCLTRDKLGAEACASRPLPADAIETFVVERLHHLAADRAHAAELAKRMRARVATERQALAAQRAALPAQIGKLSAEAHSLATAVARVSGRAQRLAEERLHVTAAALDRAQTELKAVEVRLAGLDLATAEIEWVHDALANFPSLWELMTPDNRQRLVTALVEEVIVDEKKGDLQLKLACLSEAA
jgi:hypothetical protein